MSAEVERWRAVRAFHLYPRRLATVQEEAGDALAARVEKLETEKAELRELLIETNPGYRHLLPAHYGQRDDYVARRMMSLLERMDRALDRP